MARLLALLAAVLTLASCSPTRQDAPNPPAGGDEPARVEIALNWFPEHEHGGYFQAQISGLYRQEGVEVTILPGGPNAAVGTRVGSGQVAFGVLNADELLMARARGARLVALMAPLQTSPQCILVREESGFRSLRDLKGVKLAIEARTPYFAWMRRHLPLEGVEVVLATGSVAQFLVDDRYAQQAYSISEPFLVEKRGVRARCLPIAEIGFNPYASVLAVSEDLLASRPELVRKVVRASIAGWERYVRDPAEANRHILSLNPAMDAEVLSRGVRAMLPLVAGDGERPVPMGTMTRERWEELASQMAESGMFSREALDVSRAFDLRFLSGQEPSEAAAR